MTARMSGVLSLRSIMLSSFLCLSALGTTVVASTVPPGDDTGFGPAVLQWLSSQPNALVSEKVEARDGGIFAVSDISKDEVIFHIPQATLLFPEDDPEEEDTECALAQQLVSLFEQDPDHPYLRYIWKEFPHHLLPSNWTPQAKQILGKELLNRDLSRGTLQPWETQSFQGSCVTDEDLSNLSSEQVDLLEAAYRIVLSRGWVGTLVPGYDMVNHRNGQRWRNVDKIIPKSPEDWDEENHLQNRNDFIVVAIQDISAGTQLHNSYNDCGPQDPTCYALKVNYGTLDIFQEYGFVEDTPQTWVFETRIGEGAFGEDDDEDDEDDDEGLISTQRIGWELDFDDNAQRYRVTWLPVNARPRQDEQKVRSPTFGQFNWLHAQTRRLEQLDIESLVQNLPQHERSALIELHVAMITAFSQATAQLYNEYNKIDRYAIKLGQASESNGKESAQARGEIVIEALPPHTATAAAVDLESSASNSNGDTTTDGNYFYQDRASKAFANETTTSTPLLAAFHHAPERILTTPPMDRLNYEFTISQECVSNDDFPTHVDRSSSFYQSIHFHQHIHTKNTCLWLSDWLQSCTSFRPHYHEWIVHYPAMFLPKVERVLFLGGGDIMILHEIMKYEDQLEFVIGMELDQQVVRQSFRNSAILPQFHHPKVQWHFGDATKSLLSLPKEYVGTFDLVLVDLQNFVVDTVMVTETESIMDIALKMLKPSGVLARNEDFVQRKNADFTKFVVDIEIQDVPRLCQQSLTVGSPTIDFLKAPIINHGLKHQYFEFPGERANQRDQHATDRWTVYRHSFSSEEGGVVGKEPETSSSPQPAHGILHVLDIDNVSLDLTRPHVVHDRVTSTLQQQGLLPIKSIGLNQLTDEEPDGYSIVWILQQGYVSLSTWPFFQFASMDVVLWSDFDSQFSVAQTLTEAVGGIWDSGDTTWYSLVTGGMAGIQSKTTDSPIDRSSNSETIKSDSVMNDQGPSLSEAVDPKPLLRHLANDLLPVSPAILVLCPDASQQCISNESFSREPAKEVSLYACSAMFQNGTVVSYADYATCLGQTWNSLQRTVAESGPFDAIVVDENTPLEMGQVIFDIISDAQKKLKVLKSRYIVATVGTDVWTSNLIERFRTELAIFNPVFCTSLSITNGPTIGVLSKGDNAFYAHLATTVRSMEDTVRDIVHVHESKSGVVSFIPDFFPSKFVRNDMYDTSEARAQWNSQNLLGQQSILQFDIRLPKTPLQENEKILFNFHEHNWYGIWIEGTVRSASRSGSYYDIQLVNGGQNFGVDRNRLVKYRIPSTPLKFGDRVLARTRTEESDTALWNQGSITDVNADGSYKVRLFEDSYGEHVFLKDDLIYQFEMPDPTEKVSFSSQEMRTVIHNSMKEMLGSQSIVEVELTESVGDGTVAVCIGDDMLLVATWDGKLQLTVNLFSFENQKSMEGSADFLSKSLVDNVSHLALTALDHQPRGRGRIVNGWRDLNAFWFGHIYGLEDGFVSDDDEEEIF